MRSWHAMALEETYAALESGPDGLDSQRAAGLLAEHGPNILESRSKPSPVRIFFNQFREYLILVLIFAAAISVLAGETTNAFVILGIVLLVAIIGFLQEYKAERAMEALREMVTPEADVFRDGRMVSLPTRELVPGDLIFLEAGDKVPADGRIVEETRLEVVEASLTGESVPVKKSPQPLAEASPLADRTDMVFMGTIVSYGNCRAMVTATGLHTELGRISGLITQDEAQPPLKRKLAELAKRQAVLVAAISLAVFILGVSRGSPVIDTLITSIALAVAGVPEALPFIVTLALALGTQAMARKNAIVRSLPAVETLGSTTVICTDKTGTLTAGEMTVREIRTYRSVQITGSGYEPTGDFLSGGRTVDASSSDIHQLLLVAVLCNNADIAQTNGRWQVIGDPTEGALIVAAGKAGILESVRSEYAKVQEFPFDSDRKRMTIVHRLAEGGLVASCKGAPEVILERCDRILDATGTRPITKEDRRAVQAGANGMAERALRVLALAYKPLDENSESNPLEIESIESGLILAGLTGMMDPPRAEAVEAILTCQRAGIRPIMITGDHRLTAQAIGKEMGIGQGETIEGVEIEKMSDDVLEASVRVSSVFARVTAEHKVRIVSALQRQGHIVAMTGDGVNDAPALKASDIGVAMGRTGTEVAKEASDIIIIDDNFATIVGAVEEGRRIYDNIRKGTSYLLSVSFAELATIFLGVLLGFPAPLLAVQILWINVVAEEFPAIGLAVEPAQKDIMSKRPRDPKEPMPSRSLMVYTLGVAAAIVAGSLGLYAAALQAGENLDYARTVAFMGLGFLTIVNAYCSRSLEESVLRINPMSNKLLVLGIAASILALLAVVYIPFMQAIFSTTALHTESWALILAASLLVVLTSESLKRIVPGLRV